MFQFQNGTIKSPSTKVSSIPLKSFQFQNGTIKRQFPTKQHLQSPPFQFQNGTIKSGHLFLLLSGFLCFNSKMVRLKEVVIAANKYFEHVSIPKWYD